MTHAQVDPPDHGKFSYGKSPKRVLVVTEADAADTRQPSGPDATISASRLKSRR